MSTPSLRESTTTTPAEGDRDSTIATHVSFSSRDSHDRSSLGEISALSPSSFEEPPKASRKKHNKKEEIDEDNSGDSDDSSGYYDYDGVIGTSEEDETDELGPKESKLSKEDWRDWNQRFQSIAEDPSHNSNDFSSFVVDFVSAATQYAKIVIEECIPIQTKILRPVNADMLRGQSFIVHGILLRLGINVGQVIFEDDATLMRSMLEEQQGFIQCFRTSTKGLHYPYLVIIDYKGFRVLAMPVLPISYFSSQALMYGTYDAGLSVAPDNEGVLRIMQQLAASLNLKKHEFVDFGPSKTKATIYTAADCIPQYPQVQRRRNLYFTEHPWSLYRERGARLIRRLRPKIVSLNPVPLCSDSCSNFGASDPQQSQHNEEIKQATQMLLNQVIPTVATTLADVQNLENVSKFVHTYGVNIRYLGLLRKLCKDEVNKKKLLEEMVIRTLTNRLRENLRRTKLESRGLQESPLHLQVKSFLQNVSSTNKEFWTLTKEILLEKFSESLTEEEKGEQFDLSKEVNTERVARCILERLGIKVNPSSFFEVQFQARVRYFNFKLDAVECDDDLLNIVYI